MQIIKITQNKIRFIETSSMISKYNLNIRKPWDVQPNKMLFRKNQLFEGYVTLKLIVFIFFEIIKHIVNRFAKKKNKVHFRVSSLACAIPISQGGLNSPSNTMNSLVIIIHKTKTISRQQWRWMTLFKNTRMRLVTSKRVCLLYQSYWMRSQHWEYCWENILRTNGS